MQPDIAIALKGLMFIVIPFVLFFVFIAKVYPRIVDRREFKDFFGFTYNCFNVEQLLKERTLFLEGEFRTLLMSTIEIFKPLADMDISSSDTDFLLAMWNEQTKIVQRKARELERARTLAEKFGFKNEKFLVSTSLD
ncbi:MAG: hypothetical protein PHY72_01725 [Candidatus Pacebacteria bacterium]|nr:hypothetical protein [Candidatus Paceibacterota bacterium]